MAGSNVERGIRLAVINLSNALRKSYIAETIYQYHVRETTANSKKIGARFGMVNEGVKKAE